jgi:hypothetical protein
VLFFDLDGTVLNWQGTVSEELRRLGNKHFPEIRDSKGFAHRQTPRSLTCRQEVDWEGFAMRWRDSYLAAMCVPSCEIGCVTDIQSTLDVVLRSTGTRSLLAPFIVL